MLTAATDPRCANHAYNITSGEYARWQDIWPRLARVFDMDAGEPASMNLAEFTADKAPLWDAMVKKHGLKPYRFDEVLVWPRGDYVFNTNGDVMSNVTKSQLHGFHKVVDREEMFVTQPTRFRSERIVP